MKSTRRFVGALTWCVAVLVAGNAWGVIPPALKPEQSATFAIPRMSVPPRIDGRIDPAEWREAVAIGGVVDSGTDCLISRPTTFFLGWDPGHLYFACRTYVRPNSKPRIQDGRSEGLASCFDDGLELLFFPQGRNVDAQHRRTAYRMFLNCLAKTGGLTRLALGQQLANWGPHFHAAASVTPPGTAPDGGSWWELEVSTTPEDFELSGPHQAGDTWKFMLGFNHLPGWMQARIPCVGCYFDPDGKCVGTLVQNTPAVQMSMDSLSNLASQGVAAMEIAAYNPSRQPADVLVEIDVAGKLRRSETLRLPPGGQSALTLNEKLPAGVTKGLASVRVSHGRTSLLSYTALFDVGKYNNMLETAVPPDPNKFSLETRYSPVRNLLLLKADSYYLPDPAQAKTLRYRLRPQGAKRALVEGEVTNVAEWYYQDVVKLPSLRPGKYEVSAELVLRDGRTLGPLVSTIEKKDEAQAFPEWWGKKFGNVERVLPPFTPIVCKGDDIDCWGRCYTLNALGLPGALVSQGGAVLASPARIVAVVDGKEEIIPLGLPTITDAKDWRIRFEGRAAGAGLELTAQGWLEQDGLVYVELTYRPAAGKPVRLNALRIEYPLDPSSSECLVCVGPDGNFAAKSTLVLPKDKQGRLWSTLVTGLTGAHMTVGSFYPTVWIGNERRGLLWWADNDRGWVQDNAVPAHEAIRTGGAVVLRNNIVARPIELADARTIAFSYMGSPFKPLPKGWRLFAATEDGTFFEPHRGLRINPKTGKKYHEPSQGNVNWIHPESDDPAEWSKLWAEMKKEADAGVRRIRPFQPWHSRFGVTWQHMSFQLIGYGHKSAQEELYTYFGDSWNDDTWSEEYIDYAMYLFDRAFREGGVASTYWDLTFPILNRSLLTGLAYRLPDGRVQPGYFGWNCRRFFMRLWSLQHDYGLNPGAVGSHSTNAYVTVAMPWLDAILDGERDFELDASDLDWVDNYPLERMRSMSVAHNWGVGINWMANLTARDPKKFERVRRHQAEYLWMFDSWLNPALGVSVEIMLAPEAVRDWGISREDVVYHPFWRNPFVACADPDTLVSLWRMPGRGGPTRTDRVMLGIFNYNNKQSKNVELRLDLARLGLSASDGVTLATRDLYRPQAAAGSAFDAASGTLTIRGLVPHQGRVVGVRATDKAALTKANQQWRALRAGGAAELPPAVVDFGIITPQTTYAGPGQTPEIQVGEGIQVAVWRLADRVLLAVVNPDDRPKDAEIQVDLDALGLTPKLVWQEFVGVRDFVKDEKDPAATLDFYGRKLEIKALRPRSARLVGIRKY
ncbi:MAG: glycoside hydrolase domain-containing protein [Thermoguttaceae bacterium]